MFKLYDSSQKIRNIVVVEQEHAIDLEKALNIKKTHPDKIYPYFLTT